eukprot:11801022-Alexandrium_andersonii.AAC.1
MLEFGSLGLIQGGAPCSGASSSARVAAPPARPRAPPHRRRGAGRVAGGLGLLVGRGSWPPCCS